MIPVLCCSCAEAMELHCLLSEAWIYSTSSHSKKQIILYTVYMQGSGNRTWVSCWFVSPEASVEPLWVTGSWIRWAPGLIKQEFSWSYDQMHILLQCGLFTLYCCQWNKPLEIHPAVFLTHIEPDQDHRVRAVWLQWSLLTSQWSHIGLATLGQKQKL